MNFSALNEWVPGMFWYFYLKLSRDNWVYPERTCTHGSRESSGFCTIKKLGMETHKNQLYRAYRGIPIGSHEQLEDATVGRPNKPPVRICFFTRCHVSLRECVSRCWFQTFFYVHPYLGEMSLIWLYNSHMSQMGWNHQLGLPYILYLCLTFFARIIAQNSPEKKNISIFLRNLMKHARMKAKHRK